MYYQRWPFTLAFNWSIVFHTEESFKNSEFQEFQEEGELQCGSTSNVISFKLANTPLFNRSHRQAQNQCGKTLAKSIDIG